MFHGSVLWASWSSPSTQSWPQDHVLLVASPLPQGAPSAQVPVIEDHTPKQNPHSLSPWTELRGLATRSVSFSLLSGAGPAGSQDPASLSSPCTLPRQLTGPSPTTGSWLPHAQKVSESRVCQDITDWLVGELSQSADQERWFCLAGQPETSPGVMVHLCLGTPSSALNRHSPLQILMVLGLLLSLEHEGTQTNTKVWVQWGDTGIAASHYH